MIATFRPASTGIDILTKVCSCDLLLSCLVDILANTPKESNGHETMKRLRKNEDVRCYSVPWCQYPRYSCICKSECGISLQIVAGGNIVVSNRLDMKVKQETFSVALSRDMVPSARLLAYYIFDGEVVSDCLNFFVNGTGQNPVSRMC